MPSFVGDIGSPILHRTEVAAVGAVVTQFLGLKNHSKFGTDERFFRVKKTGTFLLSMHIACTLDLCQYCIQDH